MKFIKTDRITVNSEIMNGKPCIRGMKITVGAITDLIVSGVSSEEILELYPYLEKEDIKAVISYTSWCKEEYFLKSI